MTEVERAKKGDPEAFIRLIDANRSCVFSEEEPERGEEAADFADVEFRALLGALPEDSRLIFQLFYGERFTVSEIASILNQNENTVKSRLRRGRERLRASLGEGERRTAR